MFYYTRKMLEWIKYYHDYGMFRDLYYSNGRPGCYAGSVVYYWGCTVTWLNLAWHFADEFESEQNWMRMAEVVVKTLYYFFREAVCKSNASTDLFSSNKAKLQFCYWNLFRDLSYNNLSTFERNTFADLRLLQVL